MRDFNAVSAASVPAGAVKSLLIDKAAPLNSTGGQGQFFEGFKVHPVTGHHNAAFRQERFDQGGDLAREQVVLGKIMPAQVRVDQAGGCTEPGHGRGQGFGHITKDQEFIRRGGIGVRGHSAFKHEQIPALNVFAHVVVGAAIAQPKFKDRAGHLRGQCNRLIKAGALRHHSVNKNIQSAHAALLSGTNSVGFVIVMPNGGANV